MCKFWRWENSLIERKLNSSYYYLWWPLLFFFVKSISSALYSMIFFHSYLLRCFPVLKKVILNFLSTYKAQNSVNSFIRLFILKMYFYQYSFIHYFKILLIFLFFIVFMSKHKRFHCWRHLQLNMEDETDI